MSNFSLENIKEYIDYAHLRNVKVFLTLNTLIKNEEFESAYNELEQNIRNKCIPNIYMLGRAISMFIFFDYSKIHSLSKRTIGSTKKHITNFYASLDNKEDLYRANANFTQGISSYGQIYSYKTGKDIVDFAAAQFEQKGRELKNRMEDTLLTLNDENVSIDESLKLYEEGQKIVKLLEDSLSIK